VPFDLSTLNGPILAPGLGAQGATPQDLRGLFGDALPNVVPAMSRELLRNGPDLAGLRDAAARSIDACRAALAY
jgi:orotidine-5'-phosphate decarboxylase